MVGARGGRDHPPHQAGPVALIPSASEVPASLAVMQSAADPFALPAFIRNRRPHRRHGRGANRHRQPGVAGNDPPPGRAQCPDHCGLQPPRVQRHQRERLAHLSDRRERGCRAHLCRRLGLRIVASERLRITPNALPFFARAMARVMARVTNPGIWSTKRIEDLKDVPWDLEQKPGMNGPAGRSSPVYSGRQCPEGRTSGVGSAVASHRSAAPGRSE